MSNRALTFIASLSLIISLTALWVASPLASTSKLRDTVIAAFAEDPAPLYEVAVKGADAHRQQQEAKEQEAQQNKLSKVWNDLTSAPGPFLGTEKGSATIVTFFDFNCGYCRKAHEVVDQLLKEDPTLKVIYKPVALFSNPFIIHASLAAHKQGKYKAVHDALMTEQVDPSKDSLTKLAKKLGLNVPQFLKDFESEEIKKQAAENEAIYKELKLVGTPTYIIEQTAVIPGHIEKDELQSLLKTIKEERAKNPMNAAKAE